MRHHHIISLLTSTTMPSSVKHRKTSSTTTTTTTSTTTNHHSSSSSSLCRHHSSPSATATLDLLILILVLFSGTFLVTSYFSYIFNSLSLLLSHSTLTFSSPPLPPFPFILALFLSFAAVSTAFFCCATNLRSRKCQNPKCKGLKKAMEFDLQLQTEDSLKSVGTINNNSSNNSSSEIDRLPWKGGTESNPDYECLRAELRKMAPPNGRAVLLFRAKCGCPVAKLVGWGPKKGRKHKKSLGNVATNGDHR